VPVGCLEGIAEADGDSVSVACLEGIAEADGDSVSVACLEGIAEADGDQVFRSDSLVVYDILADALDEGLREASNEAMGVRLSK